jgi:hypothetical protein
MNSLLEAFEISTAEIAMRNAVRFQNAYDELKLDEPLRNELRETRVIRADQVLQDIELRELALRAEYQGLQQVRRRIQEGAHADGFSRYRERAVDERPGEFDVFICYRSDDVAEVTGIVRDLQRLGIRAFFDRDLVRPGDQVTQVLNEVLSGTRCAVIFFGDRGLGPYQGLEQGALISQLARSNCRVIPVVLASASTIVEIPPLLADIVPLDLRIPSADAIDRLFWGITGKWPGREADEPRRARLC